MNKLVVVTGGSKGIGRALVEKFGQEGFDVVTCARHEQDLEALQKTFSERFKTVRLYTLPADLSQKEEVLKLADFIKSKNTPVEILVNNAGLYVPGQVHNEAEGILEHMIQTNLYSAYHLSRALVQDMIARQNGHIFNICSTASIIPYVNGGSYCISKHALYGMNKVLREELKEHNIKVTAVLPGATKTASWEGVDIPDSRFMKPEDVADSIWGVYRLSPQAVVEEILIRPQLGDL
jgi:short-subunit dehydrogenase